MSDRLGIIFLHHALDAVTLNNYYSIRRHNPEARLTSISAGEAFPDGFSLEATPDLKARHERLARKSSDVLVCSWHLQRRAEDACDKWWIVEWDLFCNQSAREYYRGVWGFPLVASSTRHPRREKEWHWFAEVQKQVKAGVKFPPEYTPFCMGMVPFIGLISDEALRATCEMLLKNPMEAGNAEFRFATAANRCGYPACGFSPPNDQITWQLWDQLPPNPTIVHPVKFLARV